MPCLLNALPSKCLLNACTTDLPAEPLPVTAAPAEEQLPFPSTAMQVMLAQYRLQCPGSIRNDTCRLLGSLQVRLLVWRCCVASACWTNG